MSVREHFLRSHHVILAALPILWIVAGCGRPSDGAAESARIDRAAPVPPPPGNLRYPNGPVVILGASYARGWTLNLGKVAVVNRGHEGHQSWELLGRFDKDVVVSAPRAVIVWGFINDVFRAPRDGVDPALERARNSIVRMVQIARQNGIEPILATEVTVRPPDTFGERLAGLAGRLLGKTSYQARINSHVTATNQWMREFAAREEVLLLDLERALSGPDGMRRPEFAADDGSHISPAGYDALKTYAVPILRHRFESRSSAAANDSVRLRAA